MPEVMRFIIVRILIKGAKAHYGISANGGNEANPLTNSNTLSLYGLDRSAAHCQPEPVLCAKNAHLPPQSSKSLSSWNLLC